MGTPAPVVFALSISNLGVGQCGAHFKDSKVDFLNWSSHFHLTCCLIGLAPNFTAGRVLRFVFLFSCGLIFGLSCRFFGFV